MDESEDNMSSEDVWKMDTSLTARSKPKKRSLVERELETNLTARITSPVTNGDGTSLSRYGRARRLKNELESTEFKKLVLDVSKSSFTEKSPTKIHSPVYKMHASNSPCKAESPKGAFSEETHLENQIENIYQENISLSRFGSDEVISSSPAKKFPKVYIRKDLIQRREPEETIMLIKNIFSPVKNEGSKKGVSSHLNNVMGRSSEKYTFNSGSPQNGYLDNSSVVKTLDFDGTKKRKKESKDTKSSLSKNDLFDLEAKCSYQVGDLAWARMGTYPFWPCIVTRDPSTGLFVKKKLFGRTEHDIVHVTFFGDNGRRSWIVDNMLRNFLGQLEFETSRDTFTPEEKKKDPRLYGAFFISEKKLPFWNISVEEAETLLREPKRLRIDLLNDLLGKSKPVKTTPKQLKSGKITRTDSDVSLSESLYDSLFSEDDGKPEEADRCRNKAKNKSLDVSQVVTACLDNMAAKTGITMIQRQSHMDRWLQKAKSKTPEKTQVQNPIPQKDNKSGSKKKKKSSLTEMVQKPYGLRKSQTESNLTNSMPNQNKHDYSVYQNENNSAITNETDLTLDSDDVDNCVINTSGCGIGIIAKVVSLCGQTDKKTEENELTTPVMEDDSMMPKEQSKETPSEVIPEMKGQEDQQEKTPSEVIPEMKDQDEDVEKSPQKSINMETTESNYEKVELNTNDMGTNNSNNVLQIEKINNEDRDAGDVDGKESAIEDNLEPVSKNDVILDKRTEDDENIINRHIDDKEISSTVDRLSKYFINKDAINTVDKILDRKEDDIQTAGPNDMSIDNSSDNVANNILNCETDKTNFQETHSLIVENGIKNKIEGNNFPSKKDSTIKDKLENASNNNINAADDKAEANSDVTELHQCDEKESVDDLDLDYESDEFDYKLEYSPLTNDEKSDVDEDDSSVAKTSKASNVKTSPVNEKDYAFNNKIINDSKTDSELALIDKDTTIPKKNSSNVIEENGIHNDSDILNEMNEDNDSIHSEDSQPRTRSRAKKEISTSKSEKTRLDPEFQKYVELHQDTVMDEHPELNEEEINTYLFKTWLYEQSKKSDAKKADDLQQLGLVKGLWKETSQKKLSLSLKNKDYKKKITKTVEDDADTVSINSEDSGSSLVVRRTRFRRIDMAVSSKDNKSANVSPARSIDERDIETVSINSDLAENFDTRKRYKRIKTPFEVAQGMKIAEVRLENTRFNNREFELASRNSEDDEPLSTHINSDIKSLVSLSQDDKTKEPKTLSAEASLQTSHTLDLEAIKSQESSEKNIDSAETESVDSESEVPLSRRKLRTKPKVNQFKLKDDIEAETASISSQSSDLTLNRRKHRPKNEKKLEKVLDDPEFIQYLELRQDALIDENPQLTHDEVVNYLFKTWLYEENSKHELKKTDDIEQSGLVKGLAQEPQPKKIKKKVKVDKETLDDYIIKDKPKRKVIQPYYNEDLSDLEDDIKVFDIFKKCSKKHNNSSEAKDGNEMAGIVEIEDDTFAETGQENMEQEIDEVELYFEDLTKPKPNVFKGLVREKVCEICESSGNLVKCKGCNSMFHVDCVKKVEVIDVPTPSRGRKKKKKKPGRKAKSLEDSESQSDDKSRDLSEENNESIEEIAEPETCTVDAEHFETQLEAKMKEILGDIDTVHYDSYSSDDCLDWTDTIAGKCEIVDVKQKRKPDPSEYSDFKCNNCLKFDTPVCFVCKAAVSKTSVELRQRCHVAHCHKYYHLECLEQWPQTQFNGGEPSRNNKKIHEFFEALTCPRHVCHTCVSDDPRGCKTRFSGDKLARCVKCPATYHAFTKCLPAGTQILTGSHIVCPRHYEHRPGKVPCHVNTGWCFICALGGTLICCEYCPTSFHAECLNIKPPEGGYMCEDCETGRLPLYGEMVWVKLGHYRWWPGIILHPCEISDNIMAVKHSPGEFVVRFFGQYDHYWVNRGRVFPFQEGDSGRISSQKSKIDAAFTTAMEHAQRACEILKSAQPNEEESLDIASSLRPPHYVKLKVNRPCGAVLRRGDSPEGSLTQCECGARDEDPCGPYSHCLNRMLLTECGPTCRAGERCNNRAFEKRLYPKLVPYRTPHRGWGLKTLEDIKAGQFVIEYVGELIDEEEFRRRMNRKHEIRDENFYFLTLDKERMIDAGPKGNLARFMNHCCEPNCETQKWTVLGDVRVGLFALYDIPANSEVTFNYNLECAGIDKKRCLCGAKRCSGYMGAKPKQEESQPKKGKVAGKRAYKKRKPEESPSVIKKTVKRLGRPPKPRELTEIEKDLIIIRNATSSIPNDAARLSSTDSEKNTKALKRKRISFSQEEATNSDESPSTKRQKSDESPSTKLKKNDETPSTKLKKNDETPSTKRSKCDADVPTSS